MADRTTEVDEGRRRVLRAGVAGAGVVATAGVCSGCALFNKNDLDLESDEKADTLTVALSRFPQLEQPDGFVYVKANDGDDRLVILRTAAGELVALSMVCTHWSCDVDWEKDEQAFVCPCHGSRFDTAGAVTEGPAEEPLRRYPLTEDGGTLVIDLRPA